MIELFLNDIVVRFATQEEFIEIFKLNHEIFAEEIPQHNLNEDGILKDKFHIGNVYVIAELNSRLIGMVCYNPNRPFSLDHKMTNIEGHLPPHNKMVEVRLFAVKKEYRNQGVAIEMLRVLIPHLITNGYDMGVISASLQELDLYTNIGAKPFGEIVGTKEVPYQPMYFYIENLRGVFKK